MRHHVIALGLTLGLGLSAVPIAPAEAARTEARGASPVRPALARQSAA